MDAQLKRGAWPLHVIFTVGAALGNETFAISFYPLLFFLWDLCVVSAATLLKRPPTINSSNHAAAQARKVVYMWVASYIIGQSLKDIGQLPRPSEGAIVARLEGHYAAEYGMPSTHAMTAWCMPTYMAYLAYGNMPEPWHWWVVAALAGCWVSATTLSRLYMGVHSPADLWCGSALGLALLCLGIAFMDAADAWALHHPWAPILIPLGAILTAWLYPRSATWSNSAGDTVLVMSAGTGVILASFTNRDAHTATCAAPVPPVTAPTQLLRAAPFLALALTIIILGRSVTKAVALPLVRYIVHSPAYTAWVQPSPGPTAFQSRMTSDGTGEASALLSGEETPASHAQLRRRKGAKEASGPSQGAGHEAPHTAEHAPGSPGAEYEWRYDIELPVKMIVYCVVGWNTVFTSIVVLQALGFKDFGYTNGTLPNLLT